MELVWEDWVAEWAEEKGEEDAQVDREGKMGNYVSCKQDKASPLLWTECLCPYPHPPTKFLC